MHAWTAGDGNTPAHPQLFALLEAASRLGSLQAAARELAISYRNAWGIVNGATPVFGAALLKLERGRGAKLTDFGDALLQLDHRAARDLTPHFERLQRELESVITKHAGLRAAAVRIDASHDMALEYLRDLTLGSRRVHIELHTRGSLESLDSFARGGCDMAGFHVPEKVGAQLARRYRSRLNVRPAQLINLATRQQGLIVARGNPQRISKLGDLTRAGVRFINRQSGSGTRLLFDQMLAEAGLHARRIRGYASEEFTHGAVAAMVASGMADAGFAIEAAARQHGLDFVPLARERYYLAARRDAEGDRMVRLLTDVLRDRNFRSYAASLPGYDVKACGTPASLDAALPA